MAADGRWQTRPVLSRLKDSGRIDSAGIGVVDKHDAMTDKDAVLNRHAGTQKGVARNLAIRPDGDVTLNLDERANAGSVSHAAAIEIDKVRMMNYHPIAELNIRSNQSCTFLVT